MTSSTEQPETSALSHTISVLVCLDAQRRSVEPNGRALADMHAVMRGVLDDDAEALTEALNRALDIVYARMRGSPVANCHDDVVAALRGLVTGIQEYALYKSGQFFIDDKLRPAIAALAKAQGLGQ